MVPEKHRTIVIILFMICITLCFGYDRYFDHKEKQSDKEIIQKAIDKLSDNHKDLAKIIEDLEAEEIEQENKQIDIEGYDNETKEA